MHARLQPAPVGDCIEPTLAGKAFLSIADVSAYFGISKSKIYASVAAGEMPAAVRLTRQVRAWSAADLIAWVEENNPNNTGDSGDSGSSGSVGDRIARVRIEE